MLFFSTVSPSVVFAAETVNDDAQQIDEANHGEDFDWDSVEWEYIEFEDNNEEGLILTEEEFEEDFNEEN